LWTPAAPTTSATPIAIAPLRLRLTRLRGRFRLGLRFLQLGLVRLGFKIRLTIFYGFRLVARRPIGKPGLQRRGALLRRLLRLFLAPPVTVACPSTHAALVTRAGRWGQRNVCHWLVPLWCQSAGNVCDSRHCLAPGWVLGFFILRPVPTLAAGQHRCCSGFTRIFRRGHDGNQSWH